MSMIPEANKFPNQIGELRFVYKKTMKELTTKEQIAISKALAFANGLANSLPLAILLNPELFTKSLKMSANAFLKEAELQLSKYYLRSKLAKGQTEEGFSKEVDTLDGLFRKLNIASEEITEMCFELGEHEHGDGFAKEFHELREKYGIKSGSNIFL
jgi:hypothetical protein